MDIYFKKPTPKNVIKVLDKYIQQVELEKSEFKRLHKFIEDSELKVKNDLLTVINVIIEEENEHCKILKKLKKII